MDLLKITINVYNVIYIIQILFETASEVQKDK